MMNDMDIKSTNGEMESQTNRHSRKTYLSFGSYQITWTILISSQNMFLFFYYHTVVGLDPWLIFLATGISTIWASLNDPFIGFLTDRNFKWTRKWGRRFPWIVIGAILWPLTFIILFSAPDISPSNPLPAFWWLIMALLITDTFMTLADINVATLRADKFRTETERRKYSSYFGPLDMVAQVVGMIIPPLLIGYGTGKMAYTMMAIFIASISLISAVLFFPGAHEDEIIIDRYFSTEYERMNLLKAAYEVLKQRSFIAFIIHYTSFGVATTIMTAMIVYITTFVLRISFDMMTVFFAIFLMASLISVPFWLKLARRYEDNRKVYIIGSFALCIALIPLTFFQTIIDFGIFMFIAGFVIGSVWTMGIPWILSNVQDDFVVHTGKNQKGLLIGTWAIFGLVTAFIDELLIATVFSLTGFVAGYDTYEELAAVVPDMGPIIWGIRFLLGVIPMVVLLIGTIIFWKFYPLTPEKVMENKAKLKELGF